MSKLRDTISSGSTVGSGGSTTSSVINLNGGDLTGTVLFNMDGDGTADVIFQVSDFDDEDGTPAWSNVDTISGKSGTFDIGESRYDKARLKYIETSGASGASLDNIYAGFNVADRDN